MPDDPHLVLSTRRREFSAADHARSYVLFDDVTCNIPRWGAPGEPGAWNHARGLLVELVRHLPSTPVALHYRELHTGPARLPLGTTVTTVVRVAGEPVCVTSHQESAPYSELGDHWCLTVNGTRPTDGIDTYPPSLPWMAHLVRLHLRSLHPPVPPATDTGEPLVPAATSEREGPTT